MWDKAQVCQTGHIRDGTIRERGVEWGCQGWRCWRRLLWIRREILPVADSSGANSSTKRQRLGGQPALYLLFFESGSVFFWPYLSSACFSTFFKQLCVCVTLLTSCFCLFLRSEMITVGLTSSTIF